MLILIGESASGKSSIEKFLVNNYRFEKIVSYTTREPREGEVDGIDYHFITKEEFCKLKLQKFFAETACYNGWYYGTAKEDYTDNSFNKIVVLTPHGLRQINKNITGKDNSNIISFYINVPRRDRLIKILQRGDNIEESIRRNIQDLGMFDGIEDEVDYTISNNNYELAIEQISDVIYSIYSNN